MHIYFVAVLQLNPPLNLFLSFHSIPVLRAKQRCLAYLPIGAYWCRIGGCLNLRKVALPNNHCLVNTILFSHSSTYWQLKEEGKKQVHQYKLISICNKNIRYILKNYITLTQTVTTEEPLTKSIYTKYKNKKLYYIRPATDRGDEEGDELEANT